MTQAATRGRVLVTGSNRGIGLELVRQYAQGGYEVIATCRNPDGADELNGLDGAVSVRRLDVTSETDLEQLVAGLDGVAIDILIGNAAVIGGVRSRFGTVNFSDWKAALEVNLFGNIRIATSLWRNVAASAQRKIVFVSSRAGIPRESTPGQSYIYTSSKAALNSAAHCLALDLVAEGVTAVLLNPGHVKTGIGGAKAPMTPAESVAHMLEVIERVTPSDAGKFLHFDGQDLKL